MELENFKKPEETPVIRTGWGYGVVLLLVGLFSVVAFWGVHRTIRINKTASAVINIVGKQRMLIQRVYMLCGEITLRKDDRSLKLLRENIFATAHQMERSHGWILNGNMELGLPGAPPPSVKAMLFEKPMLLDERIRRFASAAKEFSTKPENELVRESPLFKAIENEASLEANLIRDWNAVANQYQKESEKEGEKTETVEIYLLGGILALQLVSSLFVFRPLAQRLKTETLRHIKSERLFRSLTESANDAIISADKTGAIVAWNVGAHRLFGYSEAEILGKPLSVIIPARYREAHNNGFTRAALTHEFRIIGKTVELHGSRKDGSEFPLELSVASSNTDEEVCFSAIIRDITTRKEAEKVRNRFFTLPLDMMVIAGMDGYFKKVNPSFIKTVGYSEGDLMGKPFIEFIHPDDRQSTIAEVEKQLKGGSTQDFENRYLCKDGKYRWLSWKAVADLDEGCLYATARDVTERKRIEEEKDRFFTLPLDMMVNVGLDGYFKKANPSFIKMLGYSERELMERPFIDFIHPDDRERSLEELERQFKAGVTQDFENRYLCKDGTYRWLSWKVVVVFEEGLKYATVRDVTERKKIEESNKLKTEYLELLREITSCCNEARTANDALKVFIDKICAYIGWPVGHVFAPDGTGKIVSSGVWHFDDEVQFRQFRKISDETVFEPGKGLVGRVWQGKGTEWITDVTVGTSFIRLPRTAEEGADFGVRSAFAFPVLEEGNVEAVLEFFSPNVVAPVESFLNLVTHLASELGLIFSKKKAEQRLRDSEKRYKSLTESANDAIISADNAGKIVFWNKGARELFGYEENEVVGKSLVILMPERYRDAHSKGIARATTTGQFRTQGKTLELCGLKKGGGEFPLEISVATWNAGDEMFFSAIIRDISYRKEAERELNILRNAVEQAAEMVVITDSEGVIEYVNPAFERVTGLSAEETIGSNPRVLKSGRQPREFYEEMWGTIKSGRIWSGRLINKKKSGKEYFEEMTISPVQGEDGKIGHYIAIKRDISESMAMRDQLIQAEKLSSIGTLVSGVAHEMNNPLTAILGFSEMLLSKGSDLPPDVAKGIGVISQQAERTSKIVRDLLRFSRKQDVEKTSLEISNVLESVLSLQAHSLRADNIELLRDYGAATMRVFGNMSQLQQVFLNIIQNGAYEIKKTRRKGVISVRAELREGEVVVSLENNGPAIPPDIMGRLFDPFFTTKEVGDGTGLGLSISYGIVQDHGGRVWAENIEGLGVRFVVALPLDEREVSAVRAADAPSRLEFSGIRALVVEDEQEVREWLLKLLRANGAVVHPSENGWEAIELIKENDYDLVISDLNMPVMDGFKMGEWLSEHRPDYFRRFVLITGVIDSEVVEFSKNYGFRVLQKPFSQYELFETIREMPRLTALGEI